MITWGDVTRVFICCALVIFWFINFLFMWEMHEEIRSVRSDVDKLMLTQKPLVKLQGKYINLFVREDEVFIETSKKIKN